MNFLLHTSVVRDLIKQGDLLNTVNGGTSQLTFSTVEVNGGLMLTVRAPTVAPESLNIVVKGNTF